MTIEGLETVELTSGDARGSRSRDGRCFYLDETTTKNVRGALNRERDVLVAPPGEARSHFIEIELVTRAP